MKRMLLVILSAGMCSGSVALETIAGFKDFCGCEP